MLAAAVCKVGPMSVRVLKQRRGGIYRSNGDDVPATTGAAASRSRDNVALVVNRSNRSEVRRDTEDRVKLVCLFTRLRSDSVGSSLSVGASGLSSLISTAAVHEGVAHELSDDVDVLSGAMVVGSYFCGLI